MVVNTSHFSGIPEEQSFSSGIGRELTICTTENDEKGIGNDYIAVSCELYSGASFTE